MNADQFVRYNGCVKILIVSLTLSVDYRNVVKVDIELSLLYPIRS